MKLLKLKAVRIAGVIFGLLLAVMAAMTLSEMYVRSKVPVSLGFSSAFVDLWDKGYVSLEGTWTIEGAGHAYPLNASTIVCRAETKTCIDSMARISQLGSTPMLTVGEDSHEVTQWDKDTLIYQSGTECVDYFYSISRMTKQVTGVELNR